MCDFLTATNKSPRMIEEAIRNEEWFKKPIWTLNWSSFIHAEQIEALTAKVKVDQVQSIDQRQIVEPSSYIFPVP